MACAQATEKAVVGTKASNHLHYNYADPCSEDFCTNNSRNLLYVNHAHANREAIKSRSIDKDDHELWLESISTIESAITPGTWHFQASNFV